MSGKHTGFTHGFAATEHDTRGALAEIMMRLRIIGVPDEQAGGVEIAVTEAVNNIVEHAYRDVDRGSIMIRAGVTGNVLRVLLVDEGAELPGAELPAGRPANIDTALDDLPEGGFGWFMIRTLTRDIRYRRWRGRNHLRLQFDLIPTVG
ncbi:ATP-binding protein [Sedimentitalea todarodis]|uniref:ATP-binding protein n=1 Tax=Sedimentitalea todarodis TaxID=1631240 RepID=A0ABU3VLJ1_9RHOB|nr:ATP-binding protein [Sedimentitalea todarodis]MDU9006835.1 ATP-binding protein [Sedimentitalea todarodis]